MKRILIVTGASSGMGSEFARQLCAARRADELWLIARREDRLRALAKELRGGTAPACHGGTAPACHGGTAPACHCIPLNIAGRSGVHAVKALLRDAYAAQPFVIDTLVCSAGFGTYGPFADTDIDRELDMIDINAASLTGICGVCLPYLERGSRIINIASLAAFSPLGNFAVYAATKAYVHSFTLALAAELKDRGIRVISVCPGPVATEFAAVASNGARTQVLHGKPADRVAAHALKLAERGRHTAIYAPWWKCKAFLSRFIGRYFFARYTYLYEKRPSQPVQARQL